MTNAAQSGPELRGANIDLEKILAPIDVSQRQTKIICTLGPSCWDIETLCQLIDKGMSVARFNFSHGDHAGHKECLDRLRQAAAIKKKNVGKLWLVETLLAKSRGWLGFSL
jgi:pyruvate kinase